ncbi:hypothetical protein [Flavobacterium sp.]|uniref:hypothetical protein n=1 Tax=Flavobacterium sp. TaxID=239 RepID=UPI00261816D9|nr:hypothetical protein [Flavobacterium sp.]
MKNITLQKFSRLQDQYHYDCILQHLNPENCFAKRQMHINAMPYANVKYCIRLLPKIINWPGVYELFAICYDVPEKEFWKARITEYYSARQYLLSELERVVKTENTIFFSQSTDSHLWKMAGADKLNPYSDTLPLVQLGKMLGQYPFDLGRRPYGEIFSLLAQTKVQNEVEQDYRKLQLS